jgi:hypothetical protein
MQQITIKLLRLSLLGLMLLMGGLSLAHAGGNVFDELVDHPKIPMLDESGDNVLDTGEPYSPKKTCEGSGCHDYDAINHAYHFEMGRDEADDHFGKKRGLPHLVSPGYFGGYTCMGGSNPIVLAKKNNASAAEFGDWGAAGWVKDCANCHAGGGFAELDRDGIRYDEKDVSTIKEFDGDYYDRVTQDDGTTKVVPHDWKKSGVVEADCMLCHAKFADLAVAEGSLIDQPADNRRGPGGWVRGQRGDFAEEGYFRETGSTIIEAMKNKDGVNMLSFSRSEQSVHNHMTGEMETSIVLDLDDNGKPILNWNAAAFDADKRVVIPMLRFPDNDNCMACHRTSNSRRGFYGFGDDAIMTPETEDGIESTGVIVDDYKDDVHKGKVFTDDNGESRTIDNCNACHAKQYYKAIGAPIDLDANHDFPKGNSDMDVRNDLDYAPNAMSCEYCHETAVNKVVPSGHTDGMLGAHRELWKGNGDMAGYSADSLTKITQTHLDVVGCQTCHITNKRGRVEDAMMYRYRQAEDGQQKIIPYKPRYRYYWKDAVTGDVLVKSDRNAIFKKGEDDDGLFGIIFDPETGAEFGRVSARISHGSIRYSDPDTYEGYVAMKRAYDGVFKAKGYTAPNAVMVWTESNEYVISHNTRPSPESMPCGDCHAKKQSGSFSSLLSVDGVLGEANSKEVTTLPDSRLVDEGIVILDLEYMKIDADGKVTENVSDILYATKVDPFMTLLQKKGIDTVNEAVGAFAPADDNEAVFKAIALNDTDKTKLATSLQSGKGLVFKANATNEGMRGLAVIADAESTNAVVLPNYRVMLGKLNDKGIAAAKEVLSASSLGGLSSDVVYFRAHDQKRKLVNDMVGGDVLLMVPYEGAKKAVSAVNIAYINWAVDSVNTVDEADVVAIQPKVGTENGYVIFKASVTGFYFVADK